MCRPDTQKPFLEMVEELDVKCEGRGSFVNPIGSSYEDELCMFFEGSKRVPLWRWIRWSSCFPFLSFGIWHFGLKNVHTSLLFQGHLENLNSGTESQNNLLD